MLLIVPPLSAFIPTAFVPNSFIPPILLEIAALLETIPILASVSLSPVTIIVAKLFDIGSPVAPVITVPLSTLIPILPVPLTLINPVFVMSSGAFTIRTIPVFPFPPDTFICPLFTTNPLYALIDLAFV